LESEAPTNKQASGQSGIVISGDPLASRILALLLQDSRYRAQSLPIASLNESGVLEDVQLLVLTPTQALSTEERKALLTSLKEMPRETQLIVMELITLSEERREEEEAQELQTHKVPWPCKMDELERRIEAALLTALSSFREHPS
jgi:hypothetical protein